MLLRTDSPLTGAWSHPNLSERDARQLTQKIVEQLFLLGAGVADFGVHLNRDGFSFCAEVNGQRVWVQTGEGNFDYRQVAKALIAAAEKRIIEPSVLTMSTI